MSQNVFPEGVSEFSLDFLNDAEVEQHENNAYQFDFSKGDFVERTDGRTPMGTEEDALIQWCVKAIATEFGCYDAYTNFGASLEEKVGLSREEMQAEIPFEIKEALLNDPLDRVDDVNGFSFDFGTDQTIVAFTVSAGSYSERLSITI